MIWYYTMQNNFPNSSLPVWTLIAGLVRTVSCGGWVYITYGSSCNNQTCQAHCCPFPRSSDDHDAHDVLMILYIVLNLPWMLGSVSCTTNPFAKRQRSVVMLYHAQYMLMHWLLVGLWCLPREFRRSIQRFCRPTDLIGFFSHLLL
jgi:hypothetical protein